MDSNLKVWCLLDRVLAYAMNKETLSILVASKMQIRHTLMNLRALLGRSACVVMCCIFIHLLIYVLQCNLVVCSIWRASRRKQAGMCLLSMLESWFIGRQYVHYRWRTVLVVASTCEINTNCFSLSSVLGFQDLQSLLLHSFRCGFKAMSSPAVTIPSTWLVQAACAWQIQFCGLK